jgi:hypothetical protein
MCLRLARPLHLRRRVPRETREGADGASDAAARHERRERRQHAAADRDRRRGAVLAGCAAHRPGPGTAAAGAPANTRPLPRGLRVGQPACTPLSTRATRSASAAGAARRAPGGALVRARPLRPTPTPGRARGRPHRRRRARADRHRRLPRQAVLHRSGRADRGRARDALALTAPRGTGVAPGGDGRLDGPPGTGADDTRRVGDAEDPEPPVSRARAAAPARGTADAERRPLGHREARTRCDRRRRPHATRRLRRGTTTRGRALPRRHLVLPRPLRTRPAHQQTHRDRRRDSASSATPTR